MFRRNADSVVTHANLNMRIDPLERDVDPAVFWSELDRVGQQIEDDLLKTVFVSHNDSADARKCGSKADLFGSGRGLHRFDRCADDANNVETLHIKTNFARLNSTQVEQVLDQPRLHSRIAFDNRQP